MNDIPENKDLESISEEESEYKDKFDEFETVFSDPQNHSHAKGKNTKKKRILSVIAGAVAVAVLVGGTLAVIKFIPEKDKDGENQSSTLFEEIKVTDYASSDLDNVTVKNSKGTFKFYSKKQKEKATDSSSSSSSTEETVKWYVEGADNSLIDETSIESIVDCAAAITAIREINTKSADECGLLTPKLKIDVKSKSKGDYSVLVGLESPDSTGVYLKLSNKDSIYIVEESAISAFDFELLDLADTSAFSAASFKGDVSKYYENDTLSTFDSLVISGKKFPDKLTIKPNKDKSFEFIPYAITTPEERFCDVDSQNITNVVGIFSNGITISGAYSFDLSEQSLKKYKLDKPDVEVAISLAKQTKTYKFSFIDDEYCAVINDQSKMIYKVAISDVEFINCSIEDFYGKWVCMQSINDISDFTVKAEGKEYNFSIFYDDSEDAEETYVIKYNGKKLTAENFQNFYQYFVGMEACDFGTEKLDEKPDVTVSFTLKKTKQVKIVSYTKCSATKYQYAINGKPMGRITSSSLNKLVSYVKLVCENKAIS